MLLTTPKSDEVKALRKELSEIKDMMQQQFWKLDPISPKAPNNKGETAKSDSTPLQDFFKREIKDP